MMLVDGTPPSRRTLDKKRHHHCHKLPACVPPLPICEKLQEEDPSPSPFGSPRMNRSYSSSLPSDRDSAEDDEPIEDDSDRGEKGSPLRLLPRRPSQSAGGCSLIFNVGDYQVYEKLGKGSAGTVYLAYSVAAKDKPPVVRGLTHRPPPPSPWPLALHAC